MRLVAYFALMTYCLVSKTEKLMVRSVRFRLFGVVTAIYGKDVRQ